MTGALWIVAIVAFAGSPSAADSRQLDELLKTAAAHSDGLRGDQALAAAAEAERIAAPARNYAALSTVERIRAVVARHRGQQLRSITHAEAAVAHARRAADPVLLSLGLAQVGYGYQELGDWTRTLDYARRAYEAHPAPTDLIRLQYLVQRGIVLHEFREGADSLASFREALDIARRIDHHRYIGFALMEIGMTIWLVEGRPLEALPYFNEALHWARRAGAVTLEPPIFTNWGGALRDLKRYDEAIATFRKGLAIRPNGQPTSGAPTLTKNLGQTLALAGRAVEAEPILLEAVALADRMERSHVRWQARMELGMLLARREPERADRYFAESIAALEAQNSNVLLENFRAGLFGSWLNKYDPFDRYIDFLLDQRQDARVVDVIERARARAFLDTLSDARQQLAGVIPSAFQDREREVLAEISKLQAAARSSELPATVRAEHAQRIADAEERLSALRLRFAADHPALAQARYPKLWDAASLSRDVLAENEYLLMFYVGVRQTTCVVVSRAGQTVMRLPSRETLSPLVKAYLDALKNPASKTRASAEMLRSALGPALSGIPVGARLIVVPHGVLNYVPFEALQTATGEYLGERHAIAYAPSASSLAFLRQVPAAPATATGPALLAVGNPPAQAAEAAFQRSNTWQQVAHLKPLAWAGLELRQVAARFGAGARILQGRQATESALARAGIQKASVLHFATHGVIDEEKPERTALALAPQPPFDDGMLQVREIYRWKLGATLVTLSACETALGRHVTGEGLVGLARAFFAAGATAVAASLWSVNDEGTATFMGHFYEGLRDGRRIDDAARDARRAMIRKGGKFAHPYYWAPFVVSGDASRRIDVTTTPHVSPRPFLWLGAGMAVGFVILIGSRRRG